MSRTIDLRELHAAIGSAEIDSTASVSIDDPTAGLVLQGELRSLPIAELHRLWPPGAAASTREWIERNIRDGAVSRCLFTLRLPAADARSKGLEANAVDVRFDFQGLTVDYLRDLAPLMEARGSGTLNAERFQGRVTGGKVGGLDGRWRVGGDSLRSGSGTLEGQRRRLGSEPRGAHDPRPAAARHPAADRHSCERPRRHEPKPRRGRDAAQGRTPLHGRQGHGEERASRREPDEPLGRSWHRGRGPDGPSRRSKRERRRGKRPHRLTHASRTAHAVAVAYVPSASGSDDRLDIAIEGSDLLAKAVATLDGKTIRALSVGRLRYGGNDLAAELTRRESGGYRLSVDARERRPRAVSSRAWARRAAGRHRTSGLRRRLSRRAREHRPRRRVVRGGGCRA